MVPGSHEFLNNLHSYMIPCNNYKFTPTTINSLPKSYSNFKCEETPVQGGREDLSNGLCLRNWNGGLKLTFLRTEYFDFL